MTNHTINKLAEYFEKLPGIGPRQARRFVYALLKKDIDFLKDFSALISELKQELNICPDCNKFFETNTGNTKCLICSSKNRNKKILLIVEKDLDSNNIEKSGSYNGLYFVLGGLIPGIGAELPKEVKAKELYTRAEKLISIENLEEIILAFSATPEGENTTIYITKILEPLNTKISRLGRGLSTGTEIEYADSDTLKNALERRRV